MLEYFLHLEKNYKILNHYPHILLHLKLPLHLMYQ
nr:MAG TPA: hypothetical protein [Caudoviricetes sp.]